MSENSKAGRHFALIQLARIGGVAMAIAALLALRGRLDLPVALAWILLLAGLAATFLLPQLLARRWRSPDR